MASDEDIQSFLSSPLVKWAASLLPGGDDLSWLTLARGVTLANLLEGLDANFQIEVDADPIDTAARAKNIKNLLKSIKYFYKEILCQMLVISLPSHRDLSQIPPTTTSLANMETLLLLVLGVAVQSEQKQEVIITIKNLPLETQHEIVDRIRAITDNPALVLTREVMNPAAMGDEQRDELYCLLVDHIKRLVSERDELNEDLSSTRLELDSRAPLEADTSTLATTASNHALVEVAESKAKLRKLRQQLEEKTEQLSECREELDKLSSNTAKLKAENLELCQDARAAKTYRDELDMVRERAEKVDKLEAEILRYKDKMNDIEFFKSRVEELREDNRILVETKEMLEEQLGSSRKRCETVLGLENDIIKFKGDIERLQHERDTDRSRIKELLDENSTLSFSHKSSITESQSLMVEMEAMKGTQGSKDLNVLADQLGKDAVSRVHRLELENKHLKQELDESKSKLNKKERESITEIEQEMRKANLTMSRLEDQAKRDSEAVLVAEQASASVRQEYAALETVLETLNEQFNLLQIEKDTEVEALTKQVNSLTSRASSSETQQLTSLQLENRKLVSERTVLKTQVSKFEHEKARLQNNLEISREKLATLEAADTIRSKLEKENIHLNKELENIAEVSDKYESLVEQHRVVEAKLKDGLDKVEELQADNMKFRVENQKLGRRLESVRNQNQNIADIEQEKDALKQTIGQMKTTIEQLNKGVSKQDELEVKVISSNNENNKIQRQLDNLNRKYEELSVENTEIETENKKMQKTIETLKVTVRRVNQLETENLDLEGIAHKVERENKSLMREMDRLKQAVEVKDLSLDNASAKLNHTERELQKIRKDQDSWQKTETKMQELEASNADLVSQCLADKKALLDLREELVKEKMCSEQLSSRLGQLTGQLTARETTQEAENQAAAERKKAEAGLSSVDHLSALKAERDQLSSELARLRVAAVGSEDKEAAWTRQLESLQEDLVNLSKEKAGLQVENRTLQSQSSSLLDQINSLQADYTKLEADLVKLTKQETESKQETTQLLTDQTRLQSLHDGLQQDYDRLREDRDEVKNNERNLRTEISKLRDRIAGFTQGQDDILRAKEAVDLERETLNMDKKTLSNLRSEHSRLKDDFRSLFTANERMKSEYCNLQTDYKALKTENNQLKLKNTELTGQLGDSREQLTILDVENSKVTNRCEVLHQLNLSLEEDRKSLMSQVSLLLYQYHDLLTQTLDDKEHYHEEEREYSDKMNNLRRQKEKLEEKIMEQYKKMDNTTPKKKGIGLTLVKRMKKAGSNMFLASPARNRRMEEDTSSLGSGGNDSIDSEGRSPSEAMLTSEPDLHGTDKIMFRRSLPASMMGIGLEEEEEEEGHHADNESIASYFSGLGYPDHDTIPTRDTGPGRDLFGGGRDNRELESRGEYDLSDFGAKEDPLGNSATPTQSRKSSENQPRSISRVYLSAGGADIVGGGRAGAEPRLTSWKKTGDADTSLPPLPSRRAPTPPPNRPPKPRGAESNPGTDDEENKKDRDSNSESSVWYEYGCV